MAEEELYCRAVSLCFRCSKFDVCHSKEDYARGNYDVVIECPNFNIRDEM